MDVTIWHNPRCTKSREGVALLKENGVNPVVYLYLEAPPDRAQLEEVLAALDMKASELVRRGEQAFKDRGLKDADDETMLTAMLAEPRLIERPIVVTSKGAVVGRPKEKILEVL